MRQLDPQVGAKAGSAGRRLPWFVLATLTTAACTSTTDPKIDEPTVVASVHATVTDPRVDSIMNALIQPGEPGASVIVIHQGQILHDAGYGLADLSTGTPNTPQTLYHLASAGKNITDMGIMMLKEQGLLVYNDYIAKHLPQLSRFGTRPTIAQLMHHVSGVPDYYNNATGWSKLLQIDSTPDNDDGLTLLKTWGTLSPSGVKFAYSNTGYDILGALIQTKTGLTMDDFLQQRIFQPLGMNSSFSMPNAARFADPKRAHAYDKVTSGWVLNEVGVADSIVGSSNIFTSVDDLYLYDQALYTNQLVSQTTLAAAFKPTKLNTGGTIPYGFGWNLGTYKTHSYHGHAGTQLAYKSYFLRFPNDSFSVIVLANRSDIKPQALAFQIFDLYEPGL